MKDLRCWLAGHLWDPEDDYSPCLRCNYHFSLEGNLEFGFICRLRWGLVRFFRARFAPFQKCRDCGKRFGKHDYSVNDHLPF